MTDKKRIEILEKAKERINNGANTFICLALITLVAEETGEYISPIKVFELFPELKKHQPKNRGLFGPWWGDIKGKAIRIKVLNSIIKEIKRDGKHI